MKTFFLDTNIFIQCRDLKQLPWNEVTDEDSILLLIPRPVQEEIDRNKQDGNSRRSKRARKASSFIRKIVLSENSIITIKNSGPLVKISFSPPLNLDKDISDILDITHTDDRIIAETIAYRNSHPDQDVSIITHDTNPLLTAKRCGLAYVVIPDQWLLPPEPDLRDKKIEALERSLKELQNKAPIIEIEAVSDSGKPISHLSIEIVRYDEIKENEFDELISNVKKTYPMETKFQEKPSSTIPNKFSALNSIHSVLGYTQRYLPPNDDEIEKYKNEEYPDWIEQVEMFFKSLPKSLESSTRKASISIVVTNNGNLPAENAIIEFRALGGIFLEPPDKNDDENSKKDKILKFPQPPIPPKGKWVKERNTLFSAIHAFDHFAKGFVSPVYKPLLKPFIPKPHDRNAFYWKNGKSYTISKSWTFECDEFRHKVEPEVFDMTIVIPSSNGNIEKCAIKCLVTAKNLPKPIKYVLKANIGYVKGNIIEKTKEYFLGFDILK